MSNVSNHESTDPTQEQLKYLWDEYKYRHGLCWKAIYKIIAVVTLLGVLPYAKPDVAEFLRSCVLVSGTRALKNGMKASANSLIKFTQSRLWTFSPARKQ